MSNTIMKRRCSLYTEESTPLPANASQERLSNTASRSRGSRRAVDSLGIVVGSASCCHQMPEKRERLRTAHGHTVTQRLTPSHALVISPQPEAHVCVVSVAVVSHTYRGIIMKLSICHKRRRRI